MSRRRIVVLFTLVTMTMAVWPANANAEYCEAGSDYCRPAEMMDDWKVAWSDIQFWEGIAVYMPVDEIPEQVLDIIQPQRSETEEWGLPMEKEPYWDDPDWWQTPDESQDEGCQCGEDESALFDPSEATCWIDSPFDPDGQQTH